MDIKVTSLPNSQRELTITLPWADWKGEIDHAAESLSKNTKTPGFRPGKTPRAVLEKRFGKEKILAEAGEHAVNHAYSKAVTESELKVVGRPQVNLGPVKEGEALTITVVTDVLPDITLGNWRTLAKKVNKEFSEKKSEVSKEAVTAEIERIAKMRAPLITVNRPVQNGDTALIDFTVRLDGIIIENGTSKNHPLVIGSNSFIPGFEEQIYGLSAGEEKTFPLNFPETYHAKNLAGKEAQFTVTLRAVQEIATPEIDDEFAKSLGAFDTLLALEKSIREGMEEEAKEAQKNERRTAILDALVAAQNIEYPDSLVNEELNRIQQEFSGQLSRMNATFEDFMSQSKKTESDLKAEWKPQAKKRVAAYLILDKLSQEENVFTESEEVEAEMNKAIGYFKNVKEAEKKLDMSALYNVVSEQVRNEKVFQLLETVTE